MLEVSSPLVEEMERIVVLQTEHVHVTGQLQALLAREAHGRDPRQSPGALPDVGEEPGPHLAVPGLQADVEVGHERRGPGSSQAPARCELAQGWLEAWGDLAPEPADLLPPPGQTGGLHSEPVEEEGGAGRLGEKSPADPGGETLTLLQGGLLSAGVDGDQVHGPQSGVKSPVVLQVYQSEGFSAGRDHGVLQSWQVAARERPAMIYCQDGSLTFT